MSDFLIGLIIGFIGGFTLALEMAFRDYTRREGRRNDS